MRRSLPIFTSLHNHPDAFFTQRGALNWNQTDGIFRNPGVLAGRFERTREVDNGTGDRDFAAQVGAQKPVIFAIGESYSRFILKAGGTYNCYGQRFLYEVVIPIPTV